MDFSVDLTTEYGLDIYPGDYFETGIIANEALVHGSAGRDEYKLQALLLPGKRVAGFGRNKFYKLEDLPAGLSAVEAAPAEQLTTDFDNWEDLCFKISTNVFLDQGLLSHYLTLNLTKENGQTLEIPLTRPDVKIDWQSRGTYLITIGNLS